MSKKSSDSPAGIAGGHFAKADDLNDLVVRGSSNASIEYEPACSAASLPPLLQERVIDHRRRRRERGFSPKLKVERTEAGAKIGVDFPEISSGHDLLGAALGVTEPMAVGAMIASLTAATADERGAPNEASVNFALGLAKAVEPSDGVEAMLAAQMAAVHLAAMTMLGRVTQAKTVEAAEAWQRASTKLAKTFASQVEALKKHRCGGEQRVVVERVTVNGGQAIVGSVAPGGSKNCEPTS